MVGKKHEYSDAADWWDYLVKPSIKEFCIIYSKRRASRKKDTLKFWFAYLKVCLNDKNWKEVSRVKEVIKDLILEGASGHQIRSKAANAPEELVSLFHANMELKNAKKSSLSKLKSGDEIIEDGEVIEREILGFFKALFNGHHISDLVNTGSSFMPDYSNLDVFLDRLTSLPDDIRDTLTEEMNCEELRYIILKCSNNKSPGLDGLSYEFYKCTLDIIQDDLLEVFQCQLNRNIIVKSNKEGVTRLIPKVHGVPRADELRPITLLNSDYKILTKWFVLRMRPVLPNVIRSGQLCTVGERNILFGISNILSSIALIKEKKSAGCLISLDFFKAYDRVFLGYLLKVLEKMNFGSVFVSWIRMLHDGASTCFILHGLTAFIEVSFSIRQGDPLAM